MFSPAATTTAINSTTAMIFTYTIYHYNNVIIILLLYTNHNTLCLAKPCLWLLPTGGGGSDCLRHAGQTRG